MIESLPYRDRTVVVLGLARSGRVVASALTASGARVVAWDDMPAARDAARSAGIAVADPAATEASDWSALVMSPGIPLTHPEPHPVAMRARAAGVPVVGDIELLWQARTGADFIGITGTNGKSTTTALTHHILAAAGRSVAVGGNLGTPVLSLPALGEGGLYVIEMSSFQLDLLDHARCHVALLLNVTPDHLDRHGDMAGYVAAKRRIFRNQERGDWAIIGDDDDYCRAEAARLESGPARVVRISGERRVRGGIGVADGMLIDDCAGTEAEIMSLTGVPTLPGRHNWQNAAAAYAACRAAGVGPAAISRAIATYPGLPHRQEIVGRCQGVLFVNDSKATNADAAARAIVCYPRVYWIAGGKPKAGGIESLAPLLGRIAHAYLIGAAAATFARTLEGRVAATLSGDLATALRQAAKDAAADPSGDAVVLLSPACASFDQFSDFEARGDRFRELVRDHLAEAA